MKFNKSDILKMGGTAILTVIICFFVNNWFHNRTFFGSFRSIMIPWNDASKLKNEYKGATNPHPLKTLYTEGTLTKFETLEGFKFDATQLNEIINNNKVLKFYQKADEVIFYFGKNGNITNPTIGTDVHADMHIVAIGMLNGKLLIPSDLAGQADKDASSISDHADPCPGTPGCPK